MKTNTIYFVYLVTMSKCYILAVLEFFFLQICLHFYLFKDRLYSVSAMVHANMEKMT